MPSGKNRGAFWPTRFEFALLHRQKYKRRSLVEGSYRIGMSVEASSFKRLGGVVGAGDDEDFIYRDRRLRELELQEEAGFRPIRVIRLCKNPASLALFRPV